MGLDGNLAVSLEYIRSLACIFLNLLDQLFDRLINDCTIQDTEGGMIGNKAFDPSCPLIPLELATAVSVGGAKMHRWGIIPGSTMLQVI